MDDLSLPEAKTKNAREILGNMPLGNSSALVILPRKDAPTWRALRNLKNVSIKEARNLNASDLLSNKFLIIPKDASKVLEETFLK